MVQMLVVINMLLTSKFKSIFRPLCPISFLLPRLKTSKWKCYKARAIRFLSFSYLKGMHTGELVRRGEERGAESGHTGKSLSGLTGHMLGELLLQGHEGMTNWEIHGLSSPGSDRSLLRDFSAFSRVMDNGEGFNAIYYKCNWILSQVDSYFFPTQNTLK